MIDIPRELDERYRVRRESREAPAVSREMKQLGGEQLAALRAQEGRPASISYFEEVLTSSKREEGIAASGAPVIGVYCNFTPEELIHATGAVPVRLCSGLPSAATFAEDVLPRDVCPVVKSSFGTLAGGIGLSARCRVIILPASCDGKRKLAAMVHDYADVWVVDLPVRRDYTHDMQTWVKETKLVRARLEQLTGRRITYSKLRQSVLLFHKRAEAFRELTNLRMKYPHLLSGRDAMLVTNASFTDDVESWTEAVRKLSSELRDRAKAEPATPAGFLPIVLTGSPILWPNWKVLNIIEQSGMTVVADTLCSGTQRLYDPVQVDEWTEEGIMRALALRHFSATLCPCFVDSADSIDRVLELVEDYSARGVIAHNLRLCQLIDMETLRLRPVLRDRQIPFLSIHTDLSQEDREQIKTRAEAFLEMMRQVPERGEKQ